jgi:hypothetical protein
VKAEKNQNNQEAIDGGPGSKYFGWYTFKLILRRISDQTSGFVNLVHDVIAGINTLSARDAFHLQSIANVDTGRTGTNAGQTINTVTLCLEKSSLFIGHNFLGPFSPWFSPRWVVRNDHGISVQHYRLHPSIGAGNGAHLLPKVPKIKQD